MNLIITYSFFRLLFYQGNHTQFQPFTKIIFCMVSEISFRSWNTVNGSADKCFTNRQVGCLSVIFIWKTDKQTNCNHFVKHSYKFTLILFSFPNPCNQFKGYSTSGDLVHYMYFVMSSLCQVHILIVNIIFISTCTMLEMIQKSRAWLCKLYVTFSQQIQSKVGIEKKSELRLTVQDWRVNYVT